MMRADELIGADLDYWVAKAEGKGAYLHGGYCFLSPPDNNSGTAYEPSKDWARGGPIIERENIQLSPPSSPVHRCGGPNAGNGRSSVWSACTWHRGVDGRRSIAHHETNPLVAAMRCYVRSKFGEVLP